MRTPPCLAGSQLRAYAEYPVFVALARFGRMVSGVTVRLEAVAGPKLAQVACVIEADLGEGPGVRSCATARQATGAVDEAADLGLSAARSSWLSRSPPPFC